MFEIKTEIYVDGDGDIIVALIQEDDVAELRLVSDLGRPCPATQPPSKKDSRDLRFLAEIPADRARLYIEHGCSLDDYETDRAIWVAAYAHAFASWLGDAEPLDGYCREGANQAADLADIAVLARWKARG